MKKLLLGAAAAFAIIAPGVAAADTTGFVGFGAATLDDDADSWKDDLLTIEGAVVTSLNDTWSLGFRGSNHDMGHDSHTHAYQAIDVQAFTATDTYSFGGYAGSAMDSTWGFGVGGSLYFGNFTVGGDVSYVDDRKDGGYEVTTTTARAGYYFTNNFAVTGEYGYTDSEWEGEEASIWGLGAEYQFANSPFSISANYTMADSDYNGGGGHEAETFGVGVRYHFGTSDLMSRDRSGLLNGLGTVARNHALLY